MYFIVVFKISSPVTCRYVLSGRAAAWRAAIPGRVRARRGTVCVGGLVLKVPTAGTYSPFRPLGASAEFYADSLAIAIPEPGRLPSRFWERSAAMSCDHFKSCHGKCCRRRSILTLATHELTTQVFADLFGGDILGLVVPDFWPPGDCQRLAEKFGETFVAYADPETGASEVLRSFHSQALYERQADYFAGAVGSLRAIREVAEPGFLPMSKLRAILDDEWPAGASLMRFDGHTARFGLVRNIATEARAHVDDCRRDRPDLRETAGVVAQFLANVYLTPFN